LSAGAAGAVQDLSNQLNALRVKADTAQATAQRALALAADGGDMMVDMGPVEQRLAQQARSIDALNDLVALLNADIVGLQGMEMPVVDMSPVEANTTGIARNSNDIANIREFAILLRRNQVGLEGRVSDLEADSIRRAEFDAKISDIESKLLNVSGSIETGFGWTRMNAKERDVDRIFGADFKRDLGSSIFSTGEGKDTRDDDDDDNDLDKHQHADFKEVKKGAFTNTVSVNFGYSDPLSGCGPAYGDDGSWQNCFSGVLNMNLSRAYRIHDEDEDGEYFDLAYVFNFDGAKFHYSPIGMAPITFEFGPDIDRKFTSYVLDTDNNDTTLGFAMDVRVCSWYPWHNEPS